VKVTPERAYQPHRAQTSVLSRPRDPINAWGSPRRAVLARLPTGAGARSSIVEYAREQVKRIISFTGSGFDHPFWEAGCAAQIYGGTCY
jgi:hypothetical protein